MIKDAKLSKRKRTTRGKGKKDRMEWALVSKSNPKKILKWFGPSKPSKKAVLKEERRVHSFSGSAADSLFFADNFDYGERVKRLRRKSGRLAQTKQPKRASEKIKFSLNNQTTTNEPMEADVLKELTAIANELDTRGLTKEADVLDGLLPTVKVASRELVQEVGEVKIYKDSDWDEYIVSPPNATDEEMYHTDDLDDAVGTAKHMSQTSDTGIPLEEWAGPPAGFHVLSHSTGSLNASDFKSLVETGMRVASSGGGSLGVTFIPESSDDIKESLRRRVSPNNKAYNLGSTVIIAAIDPSLLVDSGVSDEVLSSSSGLALGGAKPIKNVRVLESWGPEHRWSDNAWKLPGRFLLAAYDGANDLIYVNEEWSGSGSTDLGERMAANLTEYNAGRPRVEDDSYGSILEVNEDPDIW